MAKSTAKTKIIETALSLFNSRGSRVITTNHIAEACGISPGTLYYHFANKEEIIREIYRQMGREWAEKASGITEINMQAFHEIRNLSDTMCYKYQFLTTELYALCQADEELNRMNTALLHERKVMTRYMLEQLIINEGFEPLDEISMDALVDTIWVFAVFWYPYQLMVYPDYEGNATMPKIDVLFQKFLIKKQTPDT